MIRRLTQRLLDYASTGPRGYEGALSSRQVEEAKRIAEQREALLLRVLERDPATFQRYARLARMAGQWPTDVRAHIEQSVDREGELEEWTDHRPSGVGLTYRLRSPQTWKSWQLDFLTPPAEPVTPDARLSASGLELGGHLAVTSYTVQSAPRVQRKSTVVRKSTLPNAVVAEPLKMAVILVNVEDHATQPYTAAQIQKFVFDPFTGVSGFFYETSGKRVRLQGGPQSPEGTVIGWLTLPLPVGESCPAWDLVDGALAAAAPKLNYAEYTHVAVIFFPYLKKCKAGGEASKGTLSKIWVELPAEEFIGQPWVELAMKNAVAHEVGHTFGLHHAYDWSCFPDIVKASMAMEGCREYHGDGYSTMGSGRFLPFNAVERDRLGWLAPEEVLDLDTPGTRTYALAPLQSPGRQLKVLHLPKEVLYSSSSTMPEQIRYVVEYRQPLVGTFDAPLKGKVPDSAFNGALVRVNYSRYPNYPSSPPAGEGSVLLDMSPDKPPSDQVVDYDVALPVGQTFTDPTGITITPLSATEQGLQVRVTIPAQTPDTVPPAVRLVGLKPEIYVNTASASLFSSSLRTIPLAVEAGDNRGPIVEARFYDNEVLIGTVTSPPFRLDWDVSAVTDRSTHHVTAVVKDAAGNEGRTEATVTFIVDRTPPTVTLLSPAPNAVLSGTVPVVVQAHDDHRVDWVEVLINNRVVQGFPGASGGPYTFLWDTTQWPDGTSATLAARAFDGANNVSLTAAQTITIRNPTKPTDTTPPTVRLVEPQDGGILRGSVHVVVEASDDQAVTQIGWSFKHLASGYIRKNSGLPAGFLSGSFWNTQTSPDGVYEGSAWAVDSSGNKTTSSPIKVWVGNTTSPPDPTPPPSSTPITVVRQGDMLILSWSGGGTLQSADSVIGPWVDLNVKSPVQVQMAEAAKFYRLKPAASASASQNLGKASLPMPGRSVSPASLPMPALRRPPPEIAKRFRGLSPWNAPSLEMAPPFQGCNPGNALHCTGHSTGPSLRPVRIPQPR